MDNLWDAEHNISEYNNANRQTQKLDLGHGDTCSRCNEGVTQKMEQEFKGPESRIADLHNGIMGLRHDVDYLKKKKKQESEDE